MRKYLTDIYLPAAGMHLNVFLPSEKQIGEVIYLLGKAVEELCSGSYCCTDDSMLFYAERGDIISPELTVEEAGIRNASKLILI